MIYKLRYDQSNFLVFNIPADELIEKFGEDYFLLLNEPIWADFWKPLNVEFFDESDSGTVTTPPDITCWFIEQLVLNEKAYQLLSEDLETCGEFLEVKCEGIPYWVFHVTCRTGLDSVDESKSERQIEESGYVDMKKLVFREDSVKHILLFKTEYDSYKNIYCTDKFKSLVENHALKGLVFNTDLASVF